jgi:hypothetical protein
MTLLLVVLTCLWTTPLRCETGGGTLPVPLSNCYYLLGKLVDTHVKVAIRITPTTPELPLEKSKSRLDTPSDVDA